METGVASIYRFKALLNLYIMKRRQKMRISCSGCGKKAKKIDQLGLCSECGGMITVHYDLERMRNKPKESFFHGTGVWRYCSLLPLSSTDSPVSLGEGGTSLLRSQRLGEILGMSKLHLKNETTNPTGSFVDRGTTIEMTHARDLGYRSIACALSGNLSASVAAYAARAGMSSEALLLPSIDLAKLYQIVAYGAKISQVKNQTEAERKLIAMGEEVHCITSQSPFFLEGIKTTGIEMLEQMNWHPPDRIIVSIGSGAHLMMIWKAMKELEEIGLINASRVKMTGVQMTGCAPIVEALGKKKQASRDENSVQLAREIAIHHPHMTEWVIEAIKDSGGTAIAVEEREIIDAVQLLARAEGIFAEPAAAATIAGLKNLLEERTVERNERVICVITGTGLKEPVTSARALRRFAGSRKTAIKMEKRIEMLDLGETKESILHLLKAKDDYGYGIWKGLKQEENIQISVVSVYQHISELEAADLVRKDRIESSPKRRNRVLYSLTPRGKRYLASRTDIEK